MSQLLLQLNEECNLKHEEKCVCVFYLFTYSFYYSYVAIYFFLLIEIFLFFYVPRVFPPSVCDYLYCYFISGCLLFFICMVIMW